jgi:hypothetical protein
MRPGHKDIRCESAIFFSLSLSLYLTIILDADYKLFITRIIHQQLWSTKLKRNYIWGYANEKG